IRISDVDFDSHCIHLRLEGAKNHREHQVPIISALRPSLEELVSQVTKAGAMPHEQLFNIAWFDFRRNAYFLHLLTKVPLRSCFRRWCGECGSRWAPHHG
ncbi:site-specific integrase, partial [Klebsiella pneumoniae]|nr:site-specific integrase [Klebsiella pneumoniae]